VKTDTVSSTAPGTNGTFWAAQSLADGAAGAALLHIERARTGKGTWQEAHTWVKEATSGEVLGSTDAGLFLGAPALAFVLHTAAAPAERYQAPRRILDRYVRDIAHQRAAAGLARIGRADAAPFHEYDLLYGLTGIGALLLRTQPGSDALEHVLTYLVALTRPIKLHRRRLPGWWVGHGPHWAGGAFHGEPHANFGAAHGITGPLLLLAQAARQGLTVPGQTEAIRTVDAWLSRWRQGSPQGVWWPETITLSEITTGRPRQHCAGRPSWCYGTPSIARAGQLSAIVLGDPEKQRGFEQALADCLADPVQLAQVTDPGLCHGWAGLYQCAWRAARDAISPALTARLPTLAKTFALHARSEPLSIGFLNGHAGTTLALAVATTAEPPTTGWDACLLID